MQAVGQAEPRRAATAKPALAAAGWPTATVEPEYLVPGAVAAWQPVAPVTAMAVVVTGCPVAVAAAATTAQVALGAMLAQDPA